MTLEQAYEQLNLKNDLIPVGASNRSGRQINPTFITIHNTANPATGADALMHARYLKGQDARKRKVSWHFTVDDKCAVKHLPVKERAWHAGTTRGNTISIGIEICENEGIDHGKANDRAALLSAVLMDALGISSENVVPHQHWSGKDCPHLLLHNGGMERLIAQATKYLGQIQTTRQPSRGSAESGSGLAPTAGAEEHFFILEDEGTLGMDTVAPATRIEAAGNQYVLNVRPDDADFRDKMYEANLIEVPIRIPLEDYRKYKVPILDQGREGACTGFGLATVAHYLLRRRAIVPDANAVSARMFYEMARRYDEWDGEDYDGSSARGAMKGWHKHGICAEREWVYEPLRKGGSLTANRTADASLRPLGAYYRVNHKDIVSIHSALTEVGILYATGIVHEGWSKVDENGTIPYPNPKQGGHAFAIVAYDEEGFWIQNSWGSNWGKDGFARISYDDWLDNGTDIWVARLGAPVRLQTTQGAVSSRWNVVATAEGYNYSELRPHIISVGNNGKLRDKGTYATDENDVLEIMTRDFKNITDSWKGTFGKKRILLYAHGGLVNESGAIQRISDHRSTMLKHGIYPISFVWKSDYWTTLGNMLEDAVRRRRPEGLLDAAKDFLLDRLDDALEPLARQLTGKPQWDEMKENALGATVNQAGGARIVAEYLDELMSEDKDIELHVVGHSAGAIFHAPLVQLLATKGRIASGPLQGETGLGRTIKSCTLWAPAVTVDLFKATYSPLIRNRSIQRFALFALTDKAERDDDCARLYNKSLLYLVSNAFESRPRIPLFRDLGTPLVGMEKFLKTDDELVSLFGNRNAKLVLSPNNEPESSSGHAEARHHGDFDDDQATLLSTLKYILNNEEPLLSDVFSIHRTAQGLEDRRMSINTSMGR